MEKQEFEQMIKLLKEGNKHLEDISSHLNGIDGSLEKMRTEAKKRHRSPFDV